VLTEAAISGMTDRLLGLKENVIIGKLIPARAKIELPPEPVRDMFLGGLERPEGGAADELLALGLRESFDEEETTELELAALMAEPLGSFESPPAEKEETTEPVPEFPQMFVAEPDELEPEEETEDDEE
jgi:hypothetical protein